MFEAKTEHVIEKKKKEKLMDRKVGISFFRTRRRSLYHFIKIEGKMYTALEINSEKGE